MVGALLGSAAAITGRIGAVMAGAVAAVVIALYLLLDGPRLRERFYQTLPEPWRPGVARVERIRPTCSAATCGDSCCWA